MKAKHVKKNPFFHALIQIGAQMIHMCITFPFVLKFELAAIKKKKPIFSLFFVMPSEQHSPAEEIGLHDDGLNKPNCVKILTIFTK